MSKTVKTAILSALALFGAGAPVFAQCNLSGAPITGLRDPLIYGATSSAPLQVAPEGQPPPIGDGDWSPPVTPGHLGMPPTVLPSVPATPANDIEYPSVQVNISPYDLAAPGELGPGTWAPPPSSTPGADPGILHAPRDYYPPPARVGSVAAGGGIVGGASNQRWGGQTSADFGPYRHRGTKTCDFGEELSGTPSEDGLNHARYNATSTQDLYGSRYPMRPTKQSTGQY